MESTRKPEQELPIIRGWYEFLVWIVPRIGKFPRDLRFTLGERLETRILDVLELLVRARFAKSKVALLREANVRLDVISYLLRAAHEFQALSVKAYGDASSKLLEIGSQLGGWRRAIEREKKP